MPTLITAAVFMPARIAGDANGSSISLSRCVEVSPSATAELWSDGGMFVNPEAAFRMIGNRL